MGKTTTFGPPNKLGRCTGAPRKMVTFLVTTGYLTGKTVTSWGPEPHGDDGRVTKNMVAAGVPTFNRLPKKLPIMHPAFLWNAQTMVLPFSTDNHFHSLNEIDYEQNTQKNTIAMSVKTHYNNVYASATKHQ